MNVVMNVFDDLIEARIEPRDYFYPCFYLTSPHPISIMAEPYPFHVCDQVTFSRPTGRRPQTSSQALRCTSHTSAFVARCLKIMARIVAK